MVAVAHSMNVLVYTARIPSFRAALLPCVRFAVTTLAASTTNAKGERSLAEASDRVRELDD